MIFTLLTIYHSFEASNLILRSNILLICGKTFHILMIIHKDVVLSERRPCNAAAVPDRSKYNYSCFDQQPRNAIPWLVLGLSQEFSI